MIAKQSVYFTSDRSAVVPDGHKDAKFLIVRAGTEIDDNKIRNIDGAEELASQEPAPQETQPTEPPKAKAPAAAKATPAKKPAKNKATAKK